MELPYLERNKNRIRDLLLPTSGDPNAHASSASPRTPHIRLNERGDTSFYINSHFAYSESFPCPCRSIRCLASCRACTSVRFQRPTPLPNSHTPLSTILATLCSVWRPTLAASELPSSFLAIPIEASLPVELAVSRSTGVCLPQTVRISHEIIAVKD